MGGKTGEGEEGWGEGEGEEKRGKGKRENVRSLWLKFILPTFLPARARGSMMGGWWWWA